MGLAGSSELTTVTIKDPTIGTTVGSTTTTTQKKAVFNFDTFVQPC